MNRELAALFTLCILLGTGFASIDNQPGPSGTTGEAGTRAQPVGLSIISNITYNTTWDTSHPFIHIRTNIWVLEGALLTILPGVTVRFDPGTGLHIRGGISAIGQVFHKINFIPFADEPSPMYWKGLALQNSTGPCAFSHVSVTFSEAGIACWGAEASITNSSIEYTHYYGILAGENSTVTIRDNFINFTTWVGVITDNRSDARVEYNHIQTSNHGVVCYDVALVIGNDIMKCWIGILARGDAEIRSNQVRDCMDGIQGFYASPVIENNLIISCDGNGTRFVSSNAILRDNTLVFNIVGMDIDYASKHLLETMVNNTVNGMDIKDCFFVGERDLVIQDVTFDSGESVGYYGSYTAQGSLTLYDCRNVTIRDSTILNSVNAVFATNSTFKIYNTTIKDALRSQIYLEANATGSGFNRSVDPDSVMIGGDNCLFQTFDDLQVRALDYYGEPILGARVFVRESQLVLHDAITDKEGLTPPLLVKDRTVSDAGTISSPLSVEVLAEGYSFDPNPRTGVYVSQTQYLTFTDLGDITPPAVLAFSVTDGDRAFPVNGTFTIYFNEPMNRTSVEGAFSITGNVTGIFSWDGSNMTFIPENLEYGAYYTVVISTEAKDLWNNSLESPTYFSFTVVRPPSAGTNIILYLAVLIFVVAAIMGLLFLRKLK